MNAACAAFAEIARADAPVSRELAGKAPYFAPLSALERALDIDVRAEQILAACASSTLALGLGCRSLNAGHAELVIAGGYDALSAFVVRGFEALGALTRSHPEPFARDRDGMALGEGAALLALALPSENQPALGHLLGFGSSSDAVHPTAPDRDGNGVFAAARAALADAGLPPRAIELVSAHATSTPYNDAAEALVLKRLTAGVPVHAFKAQIGHTLGAAGALEALAALTALERGVVPATAGQGELDPDFGGELLRLARAQPMKVALKLSSAFGGVNAALVLGGSEPRAATPAPALRRVQLAAFGELVTEVDRGAIKDAALRAERAERADTTSELALSAVASLRRALGRPFCEKSAVVVGTASATLEQNAVFDARRREGRAVEPRRFPGTSPSACAGWCSIVFGLRGPSFGVGSGTNAAFEAVRTAFDLVAAGDVDEAIVVALEDAGAVTRELFGAAALPCPRHGAAALLLAAEPAEPAGEPLDRDGLERALAAAGWT
jgi:3-oxoacyl-[acyl-carrier-protein] synthase-1/3-oxoacyl-[acyl-carrier-protein] synthase II